MCCIKKKFVLRPENREPDRALQLWKRQAGGGTAPPGPKWAEKPRFFRETTGRMVWNGKHSKMKIVWRKKPDIRKKRTVFTVRFTFWRSGRDSNPRPPAWQAGVITVLTTAPGVVGSTGLEPVAPAVWRRCSTSWANCPLGEKSSTQRRPDRQALFCGFLKKFFCAGKRTGFSFSRRDVLLAGRERRC